MGRESRANPASALATSRRVHNRAALDNLGALYNAVATHDRALQFLLTPGWRGLVARFRWLFIGR